LEGYIQVIDAMSMLKNKAQADASQASILVLIIMIGIILYVLLLPGPIRDDLLNGDNSSDSGTGTSSSSNLTVFVNEHPGTIDVITQRDYTHDIPSFSLLKPTNAVELKKSNPFYVKSALFSKKIKTVPFEIKDLAHTDNVLLSFDVTGHQGVLFITLNGNVVFEGEISNYNAEPLALEKEYLQGSNTLEFYAEGVGLAFWRVNDYSIQNLRVIADVTDTAQEGSKTTFLVTRQEADNADRLFLKFNPDCDPSYVGKLTVKLNSNEVFSGVPDCGILNVHELNPTLLDIGENSLEFSTDKGSYLVDLITVETNLKDNPEPIYYFELSPADFDRLATDKYYANLTIEFVDSKDWKEGSIIVNGKELGIYTQDRIWKRTLDPYLQEGQNALKIVPKDTFNIINLVLKMEKK
jgi:hypothetical protein